MSVIGKATILLEVNAVGLQDTLKKSGDTWGDFTDRALAGTKRLDSDFDRYISSIQQKIDRIGKSADQIDLGKFIKLGATDDQISRIQKLQDLYNTRATTEAKYQEMLRDTKQAQTAAAEAVVASIAKVRQARSEAMKGVGSGLQSDLAGHDASLGSIDPFANFENQSKLLELAKKQQADAMKGVGAGLASDLAGHDARIGSFDPFTKFVDQTKLKEAAAKKAKEETDAQRAAEERLTKSHAEEEKALKKQLATMEMSATQKKRWELQYEKGFSPDQVKKLNPLLDQIGTKEKKMMEAQGLSLSRQASLLRNISMGAGHFQSLGVAFADQGSGVVEKASRSMQEVVGSMSSGFRIASNVGLSGGGGMIAAGLIGGGLVVAGGLLSKFRRQEERESELRTSLDPTIERRLSRLARRGIGDTKLIGGTEGIGGAESEDSTWRRIGMPMLGRAAHGLGLASDPDAEKVIFTEVTVEAMKSAKALSELAKTSGDAAKAGGRSALSMGALAAETSFELERIAGLRALALGADDEAAGHFGTARDLREAAKKARAVDVTTEGTSRLLSITGAGGSARDSAAVMGKTAEEAELYRLSLRKVEREIGGYTVVTTEAMDATEFYGHELRRLSAIERRTGEDLSAAKTAARIARDAEIAGLVTTRLELRRLAAATTVEASMTLGERLARDMRPLTEMFRDGSISAETFGRSVSRSLGIAVRPIDEAVDRFRALAAAERAVAAPIVVPRWLTDILGMGRTEGPAPAVAAGDRARADRARIELGRAVTGDMRSPFEIASEHIADIARAEDAAARAMPIDRRIGADGIRRLPLTDAERDAFARASGRTVLDLARSAGSLDLPAGVAALQQGSVEAYRAINAAQRAGPTEAVERTAAGIDRLVEITAAARADERAVAEAIRSGRLVIPVVD